jgi:hypothetical protein
MCLYHLPDKREMRERAHTARMKCLFDRIHALTAVSEHIPIRKPVRMLEHEPLDKTHVRSRP